MASPQAVQMSMLVSLNVKNVQRAAGVRRRRQVGDGLCQPAYGSRIAAVYPILMGHAVRSAEPCYYREILTAVGTDERHRLAADAGVCLPVPQHFATGCIHGLHDPIESSIEYQSTGRDQHITGHREAFVDFPCRRAPLEIPCDQRAARLSRRAMHAHIRTDVRGALEVARIASFDVHTEPAHGNVQKAGRCRERGVAPDRTDPCGTDIPYLQVGMWSRPRAR